MFKTPKGMDKLSLDYVVKSNLISLCQGVVLRITNASDPDFGNFFVYRGVMSGHHILDQIGSPTNPVGVRYLPEHITLFQLGVDVPKPDISLPIKDYLTRDRTRDYRAALQDLDENSSNLASALELGLSISYSGLKYDCWRLGYIDEAQDFIIENSGLDFMQKLPDDSLFTSISYRISNSRIWARLSTSFRRIDGAFDLGF